MFAAQSIHMKSFTRHDAASYTWCVRTFRYLVFSSLSMYSIFHDTPHPWSRVSFMSPSLEIILHCRVLLDVFCLRQDCITRHALFVVMHLCKLCHCRRRRIHYWNHFDHVPPYATWLHIPGTSRDTKQVVVKDLYKDNSC